MSLSADLLALGEAISPSEAELRRPMGFSAVLCPRLRSNYCPRLTWRPPADEGEQLEKDPHQREWARLWEPAKPAELDLAPAPNPKRPPRYGLAGMTGAGRRQVWRALSLMEESRERLGFWTVTLGVPEVDQLQRLGTVSVFQDRLRKELGRRLRLAGLPALVIAVCEVHPKRSRRVGIPVPHWHVVYVARKSRYHHWALDTWQLDSVIAAALVTAGVVRPDVSRSGKTVGVRKSVRAYMSCYLTKKHVSTAPYVGGPGETLLPRQWWFWTRELRDWVMRHVLPMSLEFLAWVFEFRDAIDARGLARFRLLDLPDPRAPATWEVNWLSCENVAELVQAWQQDQWDAEWERSARLASWQP